MYIDAFVNLTSKAWTLPILASLQAGVAGRQAPLLAATGANRTAFGHSMDHLMKLGLIERNPGYGHPLRPEFRLTPKGLEAAALAYKIRHVSGDRDQSVLRKSWTLPVLTSLHRSCHFNDIKRNLRTISDRALSQSLKSMESLDWVSRRVDQTARPPRALYLAVNRGEAISQLTGAKIRFDPH